MVQKASPNLRHRAELRIRLPAYSHPNFCCLIHDEIRLAKEKRRMTIFQNPESAPEQYNDDQTDDYCTVI